MGREHAPDERTAGLIHDLTNVVAGALRLAESALKRLGPKDPARDEVAAVAAACRQGADLAREILDGSPPKGRAVELNELLAAEIDLFVRAHPGLRVRLSRSEGALRVRAEAFDLRRILSNLLLNAREAMGGRGDVIVKVTVAGANAVLDVRDRGPGMEPSIATRVFEPGFTTRSGAGRGHGLKVVRRLVEGAGGIVRIASAPGKGTLVRVELPLVPKPARGSGTILVVDDQPAVRTSVGQVLAESGYHVLEAGDGRAALRLLNGTVDVLLTDLKLPDMDGAELAAAAAAARPGLKVAYLSGAARPRDAGAVFLPKPAEPDEIRERIGELLRRAP